jgi:hypothetical protein
VNDASAQGATYSASFALGNSGSVTLALYLGGTLLDELTYAGSSPWPADHAGTAIQLDPTLLDATSNDDGANWCHAISTFGSGDLGTPGAANDPCT